MFDEQVELTEKKQYVFDEQRDLFLKKKHVFVRLAIGVSWKNGIGSTKRKRSSSWKITRVR